MDWANILYRCLLYPNDFGGVKFGTHVRVSLRMNYNNSDDPLTFHVAPLSSQTFHLSSTLLYINQQMSHRLLPAFIPAVCPQVGKKNKCPKVCKRI